MQAVGVDVAVGGVPVTVLVGTEVAVEVAGVPVTVTASVTVAGGVAVLVAVPAAWVALAVGNITVNVTVGKIEVAVA